MTDSIAKALIRRAELLRELQDIDRLIELYERYVGPVDVSGGRAPGVTPAPKIRHRVRPSRGPSAPELVAQAAEKVLRESRRAIQRGELAALIEADGVTIPSQDKPRYLGTVLWRRQETFENIEGEGYILRREPPPGVKATLFDGASASEADDSQSGG